MIKKTCLVCFSSLIVLIGAVGCSSFEDDKTALTPNGDQEKVSAAIKGTEQNKPDVATTQEKIIDEVVSEAVIAKNPDLYDPNKNYGSLWQSDLFAPERFLLDIKLSDEEKKEAKILARSFESHMERSKMFMHYLLTELKERKLPIELAAVPLVESGFKPRAKSHAGAHGPWQFTRPTGKSFGLEVNSKYDEFYDFIASTEASLTYLEHLHKQFKDWSLALVAYNQGEFGIKRLIRKAKAKGVKDINVSTIQLSKTARTYIKRVRAYADILKNPSSYGVEHPAIENRIAFKRVLLDGRVKSMKEAADLAGVDLNTLKHMNAGYLTDSLNINKPHGLLIPVENVFQFEKALSMKELAPLNTLDSALEGTSKLSSLDSVPNNIKFVNN